MLSSLSLPIPFFHPSLINHTVSVDIKHHERRCYSIGILGIQILNETGQCKVMYVLRILQRIEEVAFAESGTMNELKNRVVVSTNQMTHSCCQQTSREVMERTLTPNCDRSTSIPIRRHNTRALKIACFFPGMQEGKK